MPNELVKFAEWTFFQEVQPPQDVLAMLIQGEQVYAAEITLHIIGAVLPKQTMIVTEWFHCDCIANYYDLETFSPKHCEYIGKFMRAAVDNGWIAYPHQIGQTGATVQTDVYIACGISGQIQHLIGMQSCRTIIAIDVDDNTPMMQLADVAVKGDLF